MNFWGFKPGFFKQLQELFSDFITSTHDSLKAEFYLSTAIDDLIKTKKAEVTVLVTDSQWFGVTYKEDKPLVKATMAKLIDEGIYPGKLWRFE